MDLTRALLLVAVVIAGLFLASSARAQSRRAAEAASPARVEQQLAAIDAFWKWWREAGAKHVAEAIAAKRPTEVAEDINRHVDAIDKNLAWELGAGTKSQHVFMLSSEGSPQLRVLAERWRSRAPAADATWEYAAARLPRPAFELELGGVKFPNSELRFEVSEDHNREVLDLTVYHPAFARLDERSRRSALFLLMDGLLGEDDVERWVGGLSSKTTPLENALTSEQLAARVAAFARSATGVQYIHQAGKTAKGQLLVARVNVALKRVDHLLMDTRYEVRIEGKDVTSTGTLKRAELEAVDALREELTQELGATVIHLGAETGDGATTAFFQAPREATVEQRVRAWAGKHPERRITVASAYDPEWSMLQRWR